MKFRLVKDFKFPDKPWTLYTPLGYFWCYFDWEQAWPWVWFTVSRHDDRLY